MLQNPAQFKQALLSSFSFTPTPDQNELIDKLGDFICTDSGRDLFIIRGYAGTGKTKIIADLSKVLPTFKKRSVLLAPTGRAARVLSNYAQRPAQTIHRKIYKKEVSPEGGIVFSLAPNLHKHTVFIVDEASMIGESGAEGSYNNLLSDLLEYVFSGENCKLILSGDTAQLPPVGTPLSPALNAAFLKKNYYLNIGQSELRNVVRQKDISGVLLNATNIRVHLLQDSKDFPKIETGPDVIRLQGNELEDALNDAYRNYGYEDTMVVCRSNKRANAFNQQIRYRIKWQENELSSGDLMMVVKNNYTWLGENSKTDFIANGDGLEILKVKKIREMYGFRYAEVDCRLLDFPDEKELSGMIMLDTLNSEAPALTQEQSRKLFETIMLDYADEPTKGRRFALLRQNPYYNALQVKFSYAVTCHKAQGGQWPCVFIDQGYFTDDMLNTEYLRWLYTAFTRATEKVYLVNFSEKFF